MATKKPTTETEIIPEETPETTPIVEPEPEVVTEPTPEPIEEVSPIEEQPTEVAKEEAAQVNAMPMSSSPGVEIATEKEELYTIEAADLNAYPELSQQGVQYGDKVEYNSLYVFKSATAGGQKDTKTPFPASVTSKKFASWQNR